MLMNLEQKVMDVLVTIGHSGYRIHGIIEVFLNVKVIQYDKSVRCILFDG